MAEGLCGKRSPAAQRAARKQPSTADNPQEPNQSTAPNQDPHKSSVKLWTVHNKRYDLNDFVSRHPGGVDAISLGQGFNCTELYESYHSLSNEKLVKATLSRYYVEDAPEGAPDYDTRFEWNDAPFFNALKTRVRAHFQQKPGHHASSRQWLQLIGFIVLSAVALCGFMCGKVSAMLLLPFCYWLGPSSAMHDGGHFSISNSPAVNRLLAHIGGAHMSMFSWYHQHTIGHHVSTNMVGYDPDLYHFTMMIHQHPGFRTSLEMCSLPESVFGFKRTHWWRLGLMLRVPLTTFGPSLIWDINSLITPSFEQGFLGIVPFRPKWMNNLFLHSVGRCVIIWLAIIHPITVCLVTASNWLFGSGLAILFVILPYAIHGCIFYAFSQISHVQQECHEINKRQPEKGAGTVKEIEKPTEWAVHQVEHCLDYAVGSAFWSHISVGLNLQAVHHLFPQVGWGHYTELAPILQEVCDEFNVTYATKSTFWEALSSHYRYLVDINDEPNASVWIAAPQGNASPGALHLLGQSDAVAWKTP